MTNNKQFAAAVEAWAAKTARQMEAVARDSIRDVVEDAQTPVSSGGDMPVKSGDLRDSLVTVTIGPDLKGADSYRTALATWNLGDPFKVGWSVNYALARHYSGGSGPGLLWRDKAAQKWPRIVRKNALAAKSTVR